MNNTEIKIGNLYVDKHNPESIFICLDKYNDKRFLDTSCALLYLPKNKKVVYSLNWCEENFIELECND